MQCILCDVTLRALASLLLPLLLLTPHGAASLPSKPHHRLSPDLSTWNTVPGFRNRTRQWDAALLDAATANQGHLSHVQALVAKLDAGLPIVAVAIGSSFVHDFAGCWHPSLQALLDLGIVPNPSLYPHASANVSAMKDWQSVWAKCSSGGYMEGLMDTLNRTWPHPRHIFVNNGKGGACLEMVSEAACISAYMPKQMDLILLDTVTNICDPAGGEKLLRKLLKMPSRPLVLLVSNSRSCAQGGVLERYERCSKCVYEHHGSPTQCTNLSEPYSREEYLDWDTRVAPYQGIAKHYQVPHISIVDVMQRLMDGGLDKRLGLTRLQVQSMFYQDSVHFRKEELGTLLAADLLVNFLHKSMAALAALTPWQRGQLSYQLPAATLYEKARHTYHTRCYGPTIKQAIERLQGLPENGAQSAAKELTDQVPGVFFAWGAGYKETYSVFDSLPELKVLHSSGWRLQVDYKDAHGSLKVKPGFVTRTAGSVMEVEVNSEFPELGGHTRTGQLLITHTTSYDGWGTVRVTCPSTCACNSTDIDAATKVSHSLAKMHLVEGVTQHRQCRVRFEVLARTASGGHKWKLTAVSVRVEDAAAWIHG